MSAAYTKLDLSAERFRARLAKAWKNDPTVLASFDADEASMRGDIETGVLRGAHAPAVLKGIFHGLLPGTEGATNSVNVATPGARPVPGHGQFYRLLRPGVWAAIDWTESLAYRAVAA